jgi:4'-phosphopantetheinyl transferase
VHLWCARLDADRWPSADDLPGEERRRAEALLSPRARRRWVASRWALRSTLARYLEIGPEAIVLRIASGGKPEIAGPAEPLRFNLSHSSELALIAVAWEREVGVDIERIDTRRDLLALARRGLERSEARVVERAAPEARPALFHAAWARREAAAKCHGGGLGASPSETHASVSTIDVAVAPGYAAAVAVEGGPPTLLRFAIGSRQPQHRPGRLEPGQRPAIGSANSNSPTCSTGWKSFST